MIWGILIGLFVGAGLGLLIAGILSAGKANDAYLEGRLDELADALRERVG